MGMLFQNGALLTDMTCSRMSRFRCASIPTCPNGCIRKLVLTKLQAVGLRGAADLMPAELSGGMGRRVALARAIVMDPEMLIYDEPFVGLDPISLGVILRLIRRLNDALGLTSIVVSHDVQRDLEHRRHSYLLSAARWPPSGTPQELTCKQLSRSVHQFIGGLRGRARAVPLSGARLLTASCWRREER